MPGCMTESWMAKEKFPAPWSPTAWVCEVCLQYGWERDVAKVVRVWPESELAKRFVSERLGGKIPEPAPKPKAKLKKVKTPKQAKPAEQDSGGDC